MLVHQDLTFDIDIYLAVFSGCLTPFTVREILNKTSGLSTDKRIAPPSVIATWPKPNYINPDTRGPGIIYICIIYASLGILVVGARLYARIFITKAVGFDDFLIVLGLAFSIALAVLIIVGYEVYFDGHHIWDIPLDKAPGHRLNVWICEMCYIAATCCIKISVLLFYRRLSVKFSRFFMIATWIGIIANLIYVVAFILVLLLLCRPVYAYWMSFDLAWASTHQFTCGGEYIALPLSAGISVIMDFYTASLPMFLIWNLSLPKRQKIGLYALFACGFLVVVAGIVRTILLNQLINYDYDFTWVLWEMWIWSDTELYVAIFAASAPALKPFFRRFFVEPIGSIGNSYKKKPGNGKMQIPWSSNNKSSRRSDIPGGAERIYSADYGNSRGKVDIMEAIDDVELGTRHFEIRRSQDGKKFAAEVRKTTVSDDLQVMPAVPSKGVSFHQNQDSLLSDDTMTMWELEQDLRESENHRMDPQMIGVAHAYPPPLHDLNSSYLARDVLRENERIGQQVAHPARKQKYMPSSSPSTEHRHPRTAMRTSFESFSDSEKDITNEVKASWDDGRKSSQSTSEETLHLPRMGTKR